MFLALALPALALDITTATVTITTPPTNGQSIVANGNTRTWTNAVTLPTQIATTTNGAAAAATNLFRAIAGNPFASLSLSRSSPSNITLQSFPGQTVTVTLSAGWGTVTYSTNSTTSAVAVRVPYTVESTAQRTNVVSGIVAMVDSDSVTNAIRSNAPAMANFLAKGADQVVSGSNFFGNISGNVSNLNGGTWNNGILTNGQNYGNAFQPHSIGDRSVALGLTAIAAGLYGISIGYGTTSSNSSSIAIGAGSVADGPSSTVIGDNAQVHNSTNSTALGQSAFVAPGSLGAVALGSQATASNQYATAVGFLSYAGGRLSGAFGAGAQASNDYSFAVGPNSVASASNSYAMGTAAFASHPNTVVIGYGASSSRSNQVLLGTSDQYVDIPGNLLVHGNTSNLLAAGEANFPSGSDIAFGRFALTSLANGNNAGIAIGDNVFVEVSGPSGPFSVNGIAGGRNGKLLFLVNRTGQTMTLANQSGVEPTAANRIDTLLGGDLTNGNAGLIFIYSSSAARWLLLGGSSGTNSAGGTTSVVIAGAGIAVTTNSPNSYTVAATGGGGGSDTFWQTNASGVGGIEHSNMDSSFRIDAFNPGTFAGGRTNAGGTITSTESGSFSFGSSEGASSDLGAGGFGAIALGRSIDSGQIQSVGYGSLALGYASGADSVISSEQLGSIASGGALSAGKIYALSDGAFAYGWAANAGAIISDTSRGAFSLGNAQGIGSTITATGPGALVGGVATNGAIHSASGEAGFTWGKNVTNSGNRSFAFGRSFANTDDETFTVGWGGPALIITSNGLTGPQGVIGDWTLSPDGSATFAAGNIGFSAAGDITAVTFSGNSAYVGALTNAGVAANSLLKTDANQSEAAVGSFKNLYWSGTSLDFAPTNQAAHFALMGPTNGGPSIPTWRAVVGSDLSTASIDPNAGSGTNLTIFSSSVHTQAWNFGPITTESNALGSITFKGGNQTNTGSLLLSGTNFVDKLFLYPYDVSLMRLNSGTILVAGADGAGATNSMQMWECAASERFVRGGVTVIDNGNNHFGANATFTATVTGNKGQFTDTAWATNGFLYGTTRLQLVSGSGSPEGVVAAPVGSLYSRTDGGAGTTLYVKESGSANTGWIAK
jgi:hypothetical protein